MSLSSNEESTERNLWLNYIWVDRISIYRDNATLYTPLRIFLAWIQDSRIWLILINCINFCKDCTILFMLHGKNILFAIGTQFDFCFKDGKGRGRACRRIKYVQWLFLDAEILVDLQNCTLSNNKVLLYPYMSNVTNTWIDCDDILRVERT